MPVHDGKGDDEATTTLCCIFCQRPFLVSVAFSERVQGKYHCDNCVERAWALRQPHVLSVWTLSRDELEGIATRLLTVSKPYAGRFDDASSGSWCLTFWYNEISYELLTLLSSLQVRYSFDHLHHEKDTLTCWPGDTLPWGTLGSLIKEILVHGNGRTSSDAPTPHGIGSGRDASWCLTEGEQMEGVEKKTTL